MSSILKALQKLERDTADSRGQNDPYRSLRQMVPRKMAGRSRGLFVHRAAFAAFAVVFLGAVSWSLWRHPLPGSHRPVRQASQTSGISIEKALPPSSNTDLSLSPAKVAVPAAGKDSMPITAAPRKAEPPPGATAASPPAASEGQSPSIPHKAPVERKGTHPVSSRPAASVSNSDSRPAAISEPPEENPAPAPPTTGTARPDTPKSASAKTDRSSGAPRTAPKTLSAVSSPAGHHEDLPVKTSDETGMAIQALVWSTSPEERMVVVNGNILKEGGSIENATVLRIGEDYIVVRKDGARWKLKFQLK